MVQKASKSMMGTPWWRSTVVTKDTNLFSPSALWCLARASGRQVGRELEGIVGRVGLPAWSKAEKDMAAHREEPAKVTAE